MDINNVNALVPIQNIVQPIKGIEQKGVERFDINEGSHSRLIFSGYVQNTTENIYSSPKKKIEKHTDVGEIVDIYV